jgi:hypothetical protein
MLPTVATLRRGEVEGIPAFWVDGDPADLRASLVFRAGMADLLLPRHGWLHVLEHLALHGRTTIRRPVNGQVTLLTTSFDVRSDADGVVDFFRGLSGWLAEPEFGDLNHESRVLRAEESGRGYSSVARHLVWRYGARGPGLAGYDEIGLNTLGADGLRALSRQAFSRGNAVLALSAPPPAGLELRLAEGQRWAAAPAVPCKQRVPAGFTDRVNGVALSGVLPRSTAATTLSRTLQRHLHAQFREQSGMGYSAWNSYEVVDADTAVVFAGIDVLPEGRSGLVDRVVQTVQRLGRDGSDPTDFADDIYLTVKQMREDREGTWQPWSAARNEALGRPVQGRDELVAELENLQPADLAKAARQFYQSMLIGVDPDTGHGISVPWLSAPSNPVPREGREFTPVDHPVDRSTLVVAGNQTALTGATSRIIVDHHDVAAMLRYPDGGRCLIRKDGYQLTVEPSLWRGGAAAVASLDAVLPATVQVGLPARNAAEIPRPRVDQRQRRRYYAEQFGHSPAGWAASFLFLIVIALVAVWAGLAKEIAPVVFVLIFTGRQTLRRHEAGVPWRFWR